ncbi:MAG: hypothetical protein WCE68_03080 [Anaerolineales bacterium]
MSRTLGRPGDREGQLAVLRAALQAFASITQPGGRVDLPFEWVDEKGDHEDHAAPPISGYLVRHPWLLPRLINREVNDLY